MLNGGHLYYTSDSKCERKTEIGGGTNVQVCTARQTQAKLKTEESPVLLMGLLAKGRWGDSADVFYRGCSR